MAIGPVIKDGFYYDFEREAAFTEEDLRSLEAEMARICSERQAFRKYAVPREEALRVFTERSEPYKIEIIKGLKDEEITFVENGPFTDLCEGNHLEHTGELEAFKLLSVAGAYWRGNEHNKMLQRIYGTAFWTREELAQYVTRIEEAQKRDHRKLGRQLDLFSFHAEAPGMPFYHPRGLVLYQNLTGYWQEEHRREGYLEIKTPVMLKDELWKQSGHYAHYQENMFFSKVDEGTFAVRPMNCPGGTLVYRSAQRSYRDLPLRMAELGLVHRRERSGVLHGLFRVNAFTIDDAHIFCTEDQIEPEISRCIALILRIYRTFGFQEISIGLSTRPVESMGSEEVWEKATSALRSALNANQIDYAVHEGGGAFYGPKIDFEVTDSIGREWQCGTIQLDFQMPERFGLEYIAPDNTAKRPVMVHRAVFGSIERFYGILVEHYAGVFPMWLAPVHVRVMSISEKSAEYARVLVTKLEALGFRSEGDLSAQKLGYKIREGEMMKIPYLFVVGEKEAAAGTVSVRRHGGKDLGVRSVDEIVGEMREEITAKR